MQGETVLCHRCGGELHPGRGELYLVRIEAVADPYPPVIPETDMDGALEDRIAGIIDDLRNQSEQELVDQVFRRLTIHLCNAFYRTWIENPVGE